MATNCASSTNDGQSDVNDCCDDDDFTDDTGSTEGEDDLTVRYDQSNGYAITENNVAVDVV